MRLIIGVNGLVEDAAVLRSSAFPRLDRAAIEIARHYQYQPVLEDGSIKVADSKATGGVINRIEC
jgi:protein TonB